MNRLSPKRIVAFALASLFVVATGPALAETPEATPTETPTPTPTPAVVEAPAPDAEVKTVYDSVQKAAATAADQAALTIEITAILEGFVDYPTFAKRTLKRSWPDLSKAQQTRFMMAFKALIIKTYAKRFSPKTTFEWKHRAETAFRGKTNNLAKVKTVVSNDNVSVNVDYVMTRLGDEKTGSWKAFDFEVDDVSWARNWRRQFDQVIKKDGFEKLVEKIEAQVAK
ncbi:MAG: phospholipid transport system substrate-binding protein [Myxococcota bacterium]